MNPSKLVRAWNAFWFAPISARPLGAFRIALGTLSLICVLLWIRDPIPWLTDAGMLRGQEARQIAGPLRPSVLQWIQSPAAVLAFLWCLAAVAVAFTLGLRTRFMSIILYLGMLSVHHRDLLACTGADCLLTILLFYAVLSPCGASLSLDSLLRRRRTGVVAESLIAPWGQRLIQIQISILYFSTAVIKTHGLSWLDGTAIHFPLNNEEVRRYAFGLDRAPLPLLNLLTHATMILEFSLAFLLWVRAARPLLPFLGFCLHLGMILTINAPLFSELVLAGYLVFLTPSELTGLFGLFRLPRRSRRDAAANGVRADVTPPALRGPHSLPVGSAARTVFAEAETV